MSAPLNDPNSTLFVRGRTVLTVNLGPAVVPCFAEILDREICESKVCANVLTTMFGEPTVHAHNKQGGRGRHILPD